MILDLLLGFLAAIPMMSIAEYTIHRWLMHSRTWFLQTFVDHEILHHGRYYRQFDSEPDPVGRHFNIEVSYRWPFLLAVVATVLAPLSSAPVGASFAAFLYVATWNAVHSEMHNPIGRFFASWPIYRSWRRYHYLHHRHINCNFHTILPMGLDWLLKTQAKPTKHDIVEMIRKEY